MGLTRWDLVKSQIKKQRVYKRMDSSSPCVTKLGCHSSSCTRISCMSFLHAKELFTLSISHPRMDKNLVLWYVQIWFEIGYYIDNVWHYLQNLAANLFFFSLCVQYFEKSFYEKLVGELIYCSKIWEGVSHIFLDIFWHGIGGGCDIS